MSSYNSLLKDPNLRQSLISVKQMLDDSANGIDYQYKYSCNIDYNKFIILFDVGTIGLILKIDNALDVTFLKWPYDIHYFIELHNISVNNNIKGVECLGLFLNPIISYNDYGIRYNLR